MLEVGDEERLWPLVSLEILQERWVVLFLERSAISGMNRLLVPIRLRVVSTLELVVCVLQHVEETGQQGVLEQLV